MAAIASIVAATAVVQVYLTNVSISTRAQEDSDRTLRGARSAQSAFEAFRRQRLPIGSSVDGPCDIQIGRYCYWRDDESDVAPPEEPKPIQERRAALIRQLDSASRLYPGDAWIAGQTIRYLVEAGRTDDAINAAARCRAGEAWCRALDGYAAHVGLRFARADSAFASALVAMSPEERCRWLDVGDDLADDLASMYKVLSCDAREAFARRATFIGAPLYLLGGTDLLTEHLARMTRARIAERSANPYGFSWADDQRALVLRYGWPAWYTRTRPDPGSMREASIVGHDAGMAYYFLPSAHGFDHPEQIRDSDWNLDDRRALSGYTPHYARTIHSLSTQIAAFRRGDSTLVVASWDARRDTTLIGRDLVSALVLTSPERIVAMTADSAHRARGVVSVAAVLDSGLASVEVLARADRRAARTRIGFSRAVRTGISDLLLYSPAAGSASSLEQVRDSALAGDEVPRSRVVGVYWELYGLGEVRQTVHYTLTVERQGDGWLRRMAERIGVPDKTSALRVQWDEVPEVRSAMAGRGVSVDLSRLRSGKYTMRVSARVEGAERMAEREVVVR